MRSTIYMGTEYFHPAVDEGVYSHEYVLANATVLVLAQLDLVPSSTGVLETIA